MRDLVTKMGIADFLMWVLEFRALIPIERWSLALNRILRGGGVGGGFPDQGFGILKSLAKTLLQVSRPQYPGSQQPVMEF